jgi:hypothetical protein
MWYMKSSAHTPAPRSAVWAVLADLTAWPRWSPTVRSVTRKTPGTQEGVGTAYLVRQPRLPKAIWTVTEWAPQRSFTWESRRPGISTTATHRLERAAGGGTTITLGITWAGPLAWLAKAAYGRMTRRYLDVEARALARESQTAAALSATR